MGHSIELTKRQAFLVLNGLPGMGPITLGRLLAAVDGDPRSVLAAAGDKLCDIEGVTAPMAATLLNWRRHFDLAREEEGMAKEGADFIIGSDDAYPELLREIHGPPIALYRKGTYAFDHPCVAIVGSRRATLYGQTVAKNLAGELVRAGFCVVSGLARGIDTAAHEGALAAGGRTVAVLGTGIDIVFPLENFALCRRIAETGAVLSEFPLGRTGDRQSFPIRNRVVSGISAAVIVVESDVDGGAMITARFAGEQGRTVFAVPGRIDQRTSAGCHQLIRDGATLLTAVDDIFSDLTYLDGLRPAPIPAKGEAASPAPDLAGDEKTVLARFSGGAILSPETLAAQTGLLPQELSVTLMMLELKRLIAKRIDGSYELLD